MVTVDRYFSAEFLDSISRAAPAPCKKVHAGTDDKVVMLAAYREKPRSAPSSPQDGPTAA